MEKEKVLNLNMRDYSKVIDITQTILIYLITFLTPTFLAQILKAVFSETSWVTTNSQVIVGSIVNTALIIAALNLKGWKKIIGVIMLPSISTILSGYVFGTASVYMVYMIPAIWLGNFTIVYLYKLLLLKKNLNYFLTGIIAIVCKVAIIFAGFSLLKACGVFPDKLISTLQTAMGYTQAITATIGMIISSLMYFANTKMKKAGEKTA